MGAESGRESESAGSMDPAFGPARQGVAESAREPGDSGHQQATRPAHLPATIVIEWVPGFAVEFSFDLDHGYMAQWSLGAWRIQRWSGNEANPWRAHFDAGSSEAPQSYISTMSWADSPQGAVDAVKRLAGLAIGTPTPEAGPQGGE